MTLSTFVDAATHVAQAGQCLVDARKKIDGEPEEPEMASVSLAIDFILNRLHAVAIDISLAAEPQDPDGTVDELFAHSVFYAAGKVKPS